MVSSRLLEERGSLVAHMDGLALVHGRSRGRFPDSVPAATTKRRVRHFHVDWHRNESNCDIAVLVSRGAEPQVVENSVEERKEL